jgi:hypothetical protein
VVVILKRLLPIITVGFMLSAALMPVLGSAIESERNPLFSVCELPCIGGLMPGKTEFTVVVSTLEQNFTSVFIETPETQTRTPPITFVAQLNDQTVRGTIIGTNVANTITLISDFLLIELIDLLGTPDCMYHERILENVNTFVMVQWVFDNDNVTATAFLEINSENRWQPYATVRSFRLSISDNPCRSGRLDPRAWQGFPLFWLFKYED